MAGKGKDFHFHGCYKTKDEAVEKEASVPGAFIKERTVNGHTCYLVLTAKPKSEG